MGTCPTRARMSLPAVLADAGQCIRIRDWHVSTKSHFIRRDLAAMKLGLFAFPKYLRQLNIRLILMSGEWVKTCIHVEPNRRTD